MYEMLNSLPRFLGYNKVMIHDFAKPLAQVKLTVDVAIFTVVDDALKVLLIKRTKEPFAGRWALPGGFLQQDETVSRAAERVLANKAGVRDVFTEQLYTFDESGRDPRGSVMSVAYFALVRTDELRIDSGGQTQEPTLHDIAMLPELAFDHSTMVTYAVKRLRAKLQYTNVIFSLLPEHFSLTQLQKMYETILGETLDKRNFRKKFLGLGLIEPTGAKDTGGRHRPAELYRFRNTEPTELERWF